MSSKRSVDKKNPSGLQFEEISVGFENSQNPSVLEEIQASLTVEEEKQVKELVQSDIRALVLVHLMSEILRSIIHFSKSFP